MDEDQKRLFKQCTDFISQWQYFLESKDNNYKFKKIQSEDGIDAAIECAAMMQQTGVYNNQRLGVVNPNLPEALNISPLERYKIVLYAQEPDGSLTVDIPYSIEQMVAQKEMDSFCFSHVLINVPREYILDLKK